MERIRMWAHDAPMYAGFTIITEHLERRAERASDRQAAARAAAVLRVDDPRPVPAARRRSGRAWHRVVLRRSARRLAGS